MQTKAVQVGGSGNASFTLRTESNGSPVPPEEAEEDVARLLESIQTVPAKLWKKGSVIGHGGNRGSIVFRSAVAYKVDPSMNTSELRLIRELQEKPVPGLVTPFLVTLSSSGAIDGVVMPCLTCSMQELLMQLPPIQRVQSTTSIGTAGGFCGTFPGSSGSLDEHGPAGGGGATALFAGEWTNSSNLVSPTSATVGLSAGMRIVEAGCNDPTEEGILHQVPTFRPVESLRVLGAITYQILVGLVGLKDVPHSVDGVEYAGFSHNDLRLDNVLVDAVTGHILLCDFEQVGHYTVSDCNDEKNRSLCQKDRLLSNAYIPAQGAGSRRSDEWCLGLLVLELFTGVQPLLDSEALNDDFSYDPSALAEGFDWDRRSPHDESNFPPLRDHVHTKLRSMNFLKRYHPLASAVSAAPTDSYSVGKHADPTLVEKGLEALVTPISEMCVQESKDTPNTTQSTIPKSGSVTNVFGLGGTSVSSTRGSPTPCAPPQPPGNHHHNTVALGEAFDDFLRVTLNREPAARWCVSELIKHPFILISTSPKGSLHSGSRGAQSNHTNAPTIAEDAVRKWLHSNYRPNELVPRTPSDSKP